jgi:hypothetical protein
MHGQAIGLMSAYNPADEAENPLIPACKLEIDLSKNIIK